MRSCSTKYGSIILSSQRAMRDNIYSRPTTQAQSNPSFKTSRRIQVQLPGGPKFDVLRASTCTCLPQDICKRYLLSRIALRLLKIIGPRLVGQERTGNAQLLGYGSKHLGQNFFFYFIVLDRFSCLPQDVYKHRMFTNTAKTANLSSQRA